MDNENQTNTQQGETVQPQKGGLSISVKSFISVICILLALVIVTGILTKVVPNGEYLRNDDGSYILNEANERQFVELTESNGYPIWKWLLAPILVLASSDAINIILIAFMLLVLGATFAVIEATGGIKVIALRLIKRFSTQKYKLLWVITLFFMLISSLFGIFEETLVLLPLMLIVAKSMKWDNLTAIGMSVLASGIGFSCPLLNPFSVGIASQLAGISLLNGIWLRILIFVVMWILTSLFVTFLAKRSEKSSQLTLQNEEELTLSQEEQEKEGKIFKSYCIFFIAVAAVTIIVSLLGLFVEFIQKNSLSFIMTALAFLVGGLICGTSINGSFKHTLKVFGKGALTMAPAVLLLLLAGSVKFIATEGKILDTFTHSLSNALTGLGSKYLVILVIYGVVLLLQFFISSASAKAVLLIPILLPICETLGITPTLMILAFVFGDGFTNMFFPTNPVLLIGLSVSDVSYGRWFKNTAPFQLLILILTSAILLLGVLIGY